MRHIRLFALLALALIIVACGQEPDPIVVYVTATPEASTPLAGNLPASPTSEPTETTAETPVAVVPLPTTAVPVTDTPAVVASPTATASLTETPTPTTTPRPRRTRRPTRTPTPTATFTPEATPTLDLPDVPPAEELPVIDVSNFGIQIHPFVTREEWTFVLGNIDRIDAFSWIKFQVDWSLLEPSPGNYSDLFYVYAQRVQWANFEGKRPYRVMLSVAKAPDWARAPGADLSKDGPPANPQHLANFLRAFIEETKPQDNRIHAIEIWNEPNLDREWGEGELSGRAYMELFRVAHDAIKQVAPGIQVLTAGLAPVGDLPGAASDRRYLQEMYDAGLANYGDVGVGIHPYGWANPPDERCCTTVRGYADNPVFFFAETIEDYIEIMNQRGHNAQLWITEFGWATYDRILPGQANPSAPQPFFDLISSEMQAQYTLRAMEMVQSPPLADRIAVAFLWNLNFATIGDAVANGQEQAGYSLLDAGGNPRLVYRYLQVARKEIPESMQ